MYFAVKDAVDGDFRRNCKTTNVSTTSLATTKCKGTVNRRVLVCGLDVVRLGVGVVRCLSHSRTGEGGISGTVPAALQMCLSSVDTTLHDVRWLAVVIQCDLNSSWTYPVKGR